MPSISGDFRPAPDQAEAGWFSNGFGVRLLTDWRSGGELRGASGPLRFSDVGRINLNLFANLGEQLEQALRQPWVRGQVRLSISNLFDAQQQVRSPAGTVPLNYQPGLLNPTGRTISFSIRKLFLPPPRFFRPTQGGARER